MINGDWLNTGSLKPPVIAKVFAVTVVSLALTLRLICPALVSVLPRGFCR